MTTSMPNVVSEKGALPAATTVSCIEPKNLEEARREMLRLVCLSSAAITQAIITDALLGKYLSAKFLFEAVGLLERDGNESEDPEGSESLASLLLKRWQLGSQGSGITEVPRVSSSAAPSGQAPVELSTGA